MTVQKFTKRPDEFEAMRFTGDNALAVVQWATGFAEPWKHRNPFERNAGWWVRQAEVHPGMPLRREAGVSGFVWSLVLPAAGESDAAMDHAPEAAIGDWIILLPGQTRRGTPTVMNPEAFAKAYAPAEPRETSEAPLIPQSVLDAECNSVGRAPIEHRMSAAAMEEALVAAMRLGERYEGRVHLLDVTAIRARTVLIFFLVDRQTGFHAAMRTNGVEPVFYFDFDGSWSNENRLNALRKVLAEADHQRKKWGLA